MTFSKKLFIAVFALTVVVGTALIWAAYKYVSEQTSESFVARYTVFSNVIGDTLTRLDSNTEALMLNAAQVVGARDAEKGLLSTDELSDMREQLSVTHIFVTDKKGNFIRSTNEDPKLIPNAYSFCDKYRDMISGKSKIFATPIIHPQPEPKPYKFLFIPSRGRERLLEVGVRIDFIANTLTKALGSDSNVLSMSLFDPNGTSFGTFNAKEYQFNDAKINLPQSLPAVVVQDDTLKFYTKVTSSHPSCCQCDVSRTSKNGEYYYVLESVISKKELSAILAKTKAAFIGFGIAIILIALIFGRVLVRRLVKNIETAAERVRNIKQGAGVKGRIQLGGQDEVAFLTKEFDKLLDSLEESQAKVVEAEKIQTKIQLATEVAHNIKSPILAIEMMLPTMVRLPEKVRSALRSSVREIRALADSLKKNADAMASRVPQENELIFLPTLLQDFVTQKNFEFKERKGLKVKFQSLESKNNLFIKLCSAELKSILSNIVNNAADSYGGHSGEIEIYLSGADNFCKIMIKDAGAGIPEEYLDKLGTARITFKGSECRGVGLVHAFKVVESLGGKIEVKSTVGQGTTILIILPRFIELNSDVDKSLHPQQIQNL